MTDRRAEAFAVLDTWERRAPSPRVAAVERRVIAALRSVLERHTDNGPMRYGPGVCDWCECASPCEDETDVINAVLGATNE